MKVSQAIKSFLDYPGMNSKKNSQQRPVPSHRVFQPIWLTPTDMAVHQHFDPSAYRKRKREPVFPTVDLRS